MTLVHEVVEVLQSGGIVGLPTDTLYGIGALPESEAAVRRLYELKGRPEDKPIALLVGSIEQALDLVAFSEKARLLASAHWPGPLTLVLPMIREMAPGVGDAERRTVGVRMPDLDVTLQILRAIGPLAVTSANLAGEPPTLDDASARAVFGDAVDYYVPGASPGGAGSTVIDATTEELVVLRRGPVDLGTAGR